MERARTGLPAPPAQAMPVKCSTPPRVLIDAAVLGRDQGLPGGPARPVAKRYLDRVAPALRHHRVRVQEHEQLARRLRGAQIARGGETRVLIVADHARGGRRGLGDLGRAVARRVVDDDQLVALAKLADERLQRPPKRLAVAECDDDHRQRRRGIGLGAHGGRSVERRLDQAAERIRTADPFITSEVLYQLSYGGARLSVRTSPWPRYGAAAARAKAGAVQGVARVARGTRK